MRNTLRVLDFFASLHLTIFERPGHVIARAPDAGEFLK